VPVFEPENSATYSRFSGDFCTRAVDRILHAMRKNMPTNRRKLAHSAFEENGPDPTGEGTTLSRANAACHPEEAESHAKRATPNEGSMQLASISPGRCTVLTEVSPDRAAKPGEEPAKIVRPLAEEEAVEFFMSCRLRSYSFVVSLGLLSGTFTAGLCGLAYSSALHPPAAILQSEMPESLHISPEAMQGLLIEKTAPDYPPLARQARIEGTVVLDAKISKDGSIVKISLVSGHPMLAPAAIRAVRQWRYKPYVLNGEPVEIETTVKVNFKLSEKPPTQGIVGDAPGSPPDGSIPGLTSSVPLDANGTSRQPPQLTATTLIKKVNPEYPPEARKERVEGGVVLRLILDKNGDVVGVETISGHPLLVPSATAAVKQWKYAPYMFDGQPVGIRTIVRINFSLSDNSPPGSEANAIPGTIPGGSPNPQSDVIGGILSSAPPIKPRVAAPTRIRVSQGVSQGLLLTKVNPIYPPDALKTRIQGQVVLRVNIDKEGNISKVEPVSGHELLIPAAIEAVKQWKYKPYLLNQLPVEVDTQILVNFTLSEN
jgi:TonB family protein